jgi:hypothetical protein
MLYSILSQINKGLRRIPILRKSGITISRRCFDFQTWANESLTGIPEEAIVIFPAFIITLANREILNAFPEDLQNRVFFDGGV